MINRLISEISEFFRSFFSKRDAPVKPASKQEEDVDDVARSFYKNLLDAEAKNKRQ